MLVMYYSKAGNVKRFTEKISKQGIDCLNIMENPCVEEKYVLITPTHGFGEAPKDVLYFLKTNHSKMIGVASSGNKAWGIDMFAKSGEMISKQYNVPLLHKFENSGFQKDVDLFIERVHELYGKMG